ncbi:MAG: hypothetical protein JRI81_10565 [Deltaproteobacteria bacterium]|nr:hypothetical protein [Deltaproteobacteria bacterium]
MGSCNMGGFFAPELTFAGFHHLVFTGRADRLVYLWVHDGELELRDAGHLWGKDCFETQKLIREELGDEEVEPHGQARGTPLYYRNGVQPPRAA